jgi:hypothetical protein
MSTNKKESTAQSNLEKEALEYHKKGRPGKTRDHTDNTFNRIT